MSNDVFGLNKLNEFEEYYNYNRFPVMLKGLAPMEVVNGADPDLQTYARQMEQAKKLRLIENQNFKDCNVCK